MSNIPEGRSPLEWADLRHPSTWDAEVKALRAENERLRSVLEYIRDGKQLNRIHMRRAAAAVLAELKGKDDE